MTAEKRVQCPACAGEKFDPEVDEYCFFCDGAGNVTEAEALEYRIELPQERL